MSALSHFTRYQERFFFLYGKTDDEFCLFPYGLLRLEEALYYHLKSLGYRRILFYNGRQKLYFYDHESKRLCRQDAAQTQRQAQGSERKSRVCAGPLGMRKIRRQGEAADAHTDAASEELLHFGRMSDAEVTGIMNVCMKDETVKSAVVFTDGLDFINHTDREAVRHMGLSLKEWGALFASNENICLFILPDIDTESMRQLLERNYQWQFLMARMFERRDKPSARMLCVGSPRKKEVESLFHYYRLTRNLAADWLYLPEAVINVTRQLCSRGGRR